MQEITGIPHAGTEQAYVFTEQKGCNWFLTFTNISVGLNGTDTVGGFFSTFMQISGSSKVSGFKAVAFPCGLEVKHTTWYFFIVCKLLVCLWKLKNC
jgi:hypothetical protein